MEAGKPGPDFRSAVRLPGEYFHFDCYGTVPKPHTNHLFPCAGFLVCEMDLYGLQLITDCVWVGQGDVEAAEGKVIFTRDEL